MTRITDRLSIWLLLGNASGLLLCFNAALDNKICDWPFIRAIASEFGFGATAILVAHILTAFSYSWSGALEKYKTANASLTGENAVAHGCLKLTFDVVYYVAMAVCVLGYIVGFITLIHAPLTFLNAASPALLCAQ